MAATKVYPMTYPDSTRASADAIARTLREHGIAARLRRHGDGYIVTAPRERFRAAQVTIDGCYFQRCAHA